MNAARFIVSDACVGCGRCVNVCPGGVLEMGDDRRPRMRGFEEFGWNGCWKCDHCLAVCPMGAVSVLDKQPEDSLPVAHSSEAAPVMDALVAGRRSCRRYRRRNVPRDVVDQMIDLLANAPNGGNKQQVEFTLVDDMDRMDRLRAVVRNRMGQLAEQGIYPEGFGREAYEDMRGWEQTVRPDMFFCGAPHVFIPHAPLGNGEPVQDVIIAGTYFELLCASRGLGAVMMTFPLAVLDLMPDVRALLRIPESHYVGMIIGFGYPEIPYVRGTQRCMDPHRLHRLDLPLGTGTNGRNDRFQ
ncbi:nitroreductase family protein [Collinsella sp. An2]|uniref:nitroreductase family protein n=1 Tax=Collinsella sp. An2 TaxID=1965585 RepID=UPI000B3ADA1B|nr:nitroreductase family protein [Collinsella sp. An2]OUP11085.1 hypothetical protein B5F33_01535 [Collinsella sp. An2]